ncbi:NAD-dependent epimerase/dehydratase family protein [Halogeometricum sp. S1BR25-6]|uniref:NAD-dependent epimerase/dehydratase family protein n=1 Tax=Halogeometricum salsisoli TaxID=2950536 RepID=A0ABU2GJ31_9EURY|nr:NAD-dependent epimerase/dehydratase family protein [Halogeometricum sp. S1BR25-6]MDS0300274.1 NAD-dependent epimerase/dehydratase family protein [Halogeometricum sp. S1BR25-6]
MEERVFITGIAGFLGSHLADAFIEEGYEVAGNDNLIGGYESNVPSEAEFHRIECQDVDAMKEAMGDADIVYHTAALAHEGLSVFSPALINDHLYQATSGTLAAAADCGINRFVYCSSMSRYGENETPFTEDMEPRPQDPYAVSKVAAEDLTELLADVHGFDYVVAVPHNIIGPRQKYDDPFRNVAAIFINRMLRGQQPIIYGDGEQKRCFTFIQDDVRPLKRLAHEDNVVGETINIGPDDEFITINTLAEVIADIIDFDLDPIYVPERPQEVELANCSADKARDLLGYESRYTLRDGLEEMIEWIRAEGPKEFEYHLDLEIVTEDTPDTWKEQMI